MVNGATVNALRIPAVRNTDLNAVFVCQAVNNNMSFPVSTSLRMDISCKLSSLSPLSLSVGVPPKLWDFFPISPYDSIRIKLGKMQK